MSSRIGLVWVCSVQGIRRHVNNVPAYALQAATQYPTTSDRLHVWLLVTNVSINPTCWQQHDIKYPSRLFSEALDPSDARTQLHETFMPGNSSSAESAVPPGASLAAASGSASVGGSSDNSTSAGSLVAPSDSLFALSFGFMRSAWQLSDGVPDRYLSIENVTLAQLPQGPAADTAAAAQGGQTPQDIWTVLLWCITRCAAQLRL